MVFVTMLALTAGLLASGLPQTQSSTAAEASQVEDIEVVGRMRAQHVREQVDAFIEENMAPALGRPLARWSKPVCVATAQLSPQYAQAVIDRVAFRIVEAGGMWLDRVARLMS